MELDRRTGSTISVVVGGLQRISTPSAPSQEYQKEPGSIEIDKATSGVNEPHVEEEYDVPPQPVTKEWPHCHTAQRASYKENHIPLKGGWVSGTKCAWKEEGAQEHCEKPVKHKHTDIEGIYMFTVGSA